MLWPIFWILCMLAIVGVTIGAAWKEKKARAEALKKMSPQPLGEVDASSLADPSVDGFGEPDPVESFGAEDEELASFGEEEQN